MRDLWPKDITRTDFVAPVTILKEQASLLGKRTMNIVEAQVVRVDDSRPSSFVYSFDIVAPALGGYRFKLFTILHNVEMYPLRIYPDTDLLSEFPGSVEQEKFGAFVKVETEAEFLETLRRIFAAKKTIKVINALLVQSGVGSEDKALSQMPQVQ